MIFSSMSISQEKKIRGPFFTSMKLSNRYKKIMKLKNWWEVAIVLLQSVSRDLQKLLFLIINIKNSIESLEAESLHELLIQ